MEIGVYTIAELGPSVSPAQRLRNGAGAHP